MGRIRAGQQGVSDTDHVTVVFVEPGLLIVIVPPQMHMQVHDLVSAGINPAFTFVAPGIQGATVLGMQGIGVSTPIAAAVAAATCGFAGDLHTPNGLMFNMGL